MESLGKAGETFMKCGILVTERANPKQVFAVCPRLSHSSGNFSALKRAALGPGSLGPATKSLLLAQFVLGRIAICKNVCDAMRTSTGLSDGTPGRSSVTRHGDEGLRRRCDGPQLGKQTQIKPRPRHAMAVTTESPHPFSEPMSLSVQRGRPHRQVLL